jgi:hypothetical protein
MFNHTIRFLILGSLLSGLGCQTHVHVYEPAVYEEKIYTPQPEEMILAQIDAAAGMVFPSERCDALLRIVTRPNLSDAAQMRMMEVALNRMPFPDNREKVLLRLVHNPCFSDNSATYLLGSLKRLPFPGTREKVLNALLDRGEAREVAVEVNGGEA